MLRLYAFFPWLKKQLKFKSGNVSNDKTLKPLLDFLLNSDTVPYAFDYYLTYKEDLLSDDAVIEVSDFGAGSRKMGKKRAVCDIAKYSVLNDYEAEMLCRLMYYLKPKRALELGTSLGASVLCMSSSSPDTEIHTVDACPQTHAVAKYYLGAYFPDNVCFHTQTFDDFLKEDNSVWDFVYMDGNHRYKPTVEMFELLLSRTTENAVILMDDIHWSKEMHKAWKEISRRKDVKTVDLFDAGIVMKIRG